MANVGAAERQTECAEWVAILGKSLSEAEGALKVLEDKLARVLRPSPSAPTIKDDKEAPPVHLVPLASEIRDAVGRVERLSLVLIDITNRVEA